jgi:two-component system response regulator (stage 0 sporulation protein F)
MSRILVIDDEAAVRTLLRRALEAAGHRVLEARDGREGVRAYTAESPDLVITDIVMPDQEGLQCIREMRQLDPEVRIIAISGAARYQSMDVLDIARHFGARHAFRKPFDLTQLLAAVQETLNDSRAA